MKEVVSKALNMARDCIDPTIAPPFTISTIDEALSSISVEEHEITADKIQRLQDALEGYCEGLAVEEETARAILRYAMTGEFDGEEPL